MFGWNSCWCVVEVVVASSLFSFNGASGKWERSFEVWLLVEGIDSSIILNKNYVIKNNRPKII